MRLCSGFYVRKSRVASSLFIFTQEENTLRLASVKISQPHILGFSIVNYNMVCLVSRKLSCHSSRALLTCPIDSSAVLTWQGAGWSKCVVSECVCQKVIQRSKVKVDMLRLTERDRRLLKHCTNTHSSDGCDYVLTLLMRWGNISSWVLESGIIYYLSAVYMTYCHVLHKKNIISNCNTLHYCITPKNWFSYKL